ncbi:MAG: DivIVA domain-containing protein [Actinomycetes bacterium]
MAISFSRPDPSSPAAVGSAAFPTSRRGFDQGEVRDFLRMVAAELARLQERERFLESELRGMQTRGMSAPGRLDEETVTTLLGEEAARVLSTARDASAQIRERAEESATRLVKDAAEDAARIRESAMVESARIHEDAAHDAEQEIEMAKQQGRDMVNEAREYREKVLSELSRRRDAARNQIEQLLHGRDRLLNAFERARLASEDVLAGLSDAHDEPEFIVDLAPTTGPVPIVNPAHPSVKAFDQDAAEEVIHEAPAAVADTPTVDVYDFEEDVVVETVLDSTMEEIVDVLVAMAESQHPVHIEPEVVAEVADNVEPTVETDDQQTNVVSLFGRGRKSADLPEIVDEVVVEAVVETAAPADEIISEQILEELKAELAAEKAAEKAAKAEARATTKTSSPTAKGADDIFAKLRASSTAAVAEKVSDPSTAAQPKTAEKPAKKFEAPKPKSPVAAVDPKKFEARDEALAPLVASMSRKLKRVLADEQNSVLEHLRGKRSSLEIDAILGTINEHAQRYAVSITEETMAAASDGAKAVKHSGSSRRVTQKAIGSHVADTIAQGLVAGFREDTRIAIGEAEGDRDILIGLMRDVYRKWKLDDLDSHVDNIACSAYSKGGFLSLEPGSHITWMVDPVTKCCSECDDNALGGAVTRGDSFPTGHNHPPAHPGCRCLVGPNQD